MLTAILQINAIFMQSVSEKNVYKPIVLVLFYDLPFVFLFLRVIEGLHLGFLKIFFSGTLQIVVQFRRLRFFGSRLEFHFEVDLLFGLGAL